MELLGVTVLMALSIVGGLAATRLALLVILFFLTRHAAVLDTASEPVAMERIYETHLRLGTSAS